MTSAEMRTPESVFKCGKAENYCDIKVLFKYLQAPLPQQQLNHSVACNTINAMLTQRTPIRGAEISIYAYVIHIKHHSNVEP